MVSNIYSFRRPYARENVWRAAVTRHYEYCVRLVMLKKVKACGMSRYRDASSSRCPDPTALGATFKKWVFP